jgi:ribosomal protein S18 acetylase RimI-like enzyme
MNIEAFTRHDITPFLNLAEAEGWVAEGWEFEFLLAQFSQGCFVAQVEDGQPVGFVTSIRHDRSGWIGNLIVEPAVRGQGVGEELFTRALDALWAGGVETVWLTASASGQHLYEKHGFSRIDTIARWTGTGRQKHVSQDNAPTSERSVSSMDRQAWGDRRDALLAVTVSRGRLLLDELGFLAIQPCGASKQLGPFTALDNGTAEKLLDHALCSIPHDTKLYLDAPVSNHAAMRMFSRKKLKIAGMTELMYCGRRPEYRSELIYGLATMGSSG